MKFRLFLSILLTVIAPGNFAINVHAEGIDHPTLAIGSPAPDFKLPGVDGKTYSLASFSNAKILVIVFTCNHCPTAQAYEDRIIKLTNDYTPKNVAVVAINPNDPKALRLDELDFSDLGDSFDEMKIRAREKSFNFPYLFDGETQSVARAFGPVATPHVFIFDQGRKLRYAGRFDDTESPFKVPNSNDTRDAIDALLAGRDVKVQSTKVFGCSVKWTEKTDQVQKALDKWAAEPVTVNLIDENGLREILKNSTKKLFLINVWSNNCKDCLDNFPQFVTINRMYRDRDFEFISVNTDKVAEQLNTMNFLQQEQASNRNYLFSADNEAKLIAVIDPTWNGKLPYTILVEPGGQIVYAKQGPINPADLKRTIVNNHLLGKYP